MDFWRVIGCACVNPDFHLGVYRRLKEPYSALQAFLSEEGFLLTRMDIVELRHLFARNVNRVLSSMAGRCGVVYSGRWPEDDNFLRVIGLACIDGQFRGDLYDAARKGAKPVEALLNGKPNDPKIPGYVGPRIPLKPSSCEVVSKVCGDREIFMLMDDFQKEGWWHQEKVFGSCDQGYHLKQVFKRLSSAEEAMALDSGTNIASAVELKGKEFAALEMMGSIAELERQVGGLRKQGD